jgi:hypothetical protein
VYSVNCRVGFVCFIATWLRILYKVSSLADGYKATRSWQEELRFGFGLSGYVGNNAKKRCPKGQCRSNVGVIMLLTEYETLASLGITIDQAWFRGQGIGSES